MSEMYSTGTRRTAQYREKRKREISVEYCKEDARARVAGISTLTQKKKKSCVACKGLKLHIYIYMFFFSTLIKNLSRDPSNSKRLFNGVLSSMTTATRG